MRHAAYEAPTPWALGLVVTSSLCGVSSGNMQRSSSPASALANLFMDRDRWSRWIKLSEMTWNVMNLGTRRHALSIWCQEEPTFERRRRKESPLSFKAMMATGHHWHVRPPTLPELGPLLFSQWNDIFLHTHVTLLHMNHLKDRSAALPALKIQNVWRLWRLKIWYGMVQQFVGSNLQRRGATLAASRRARRPADCGRPLREANTKLGFVEESFECSEFAVLLKKKIACYFMLPKKACKISIRSNAICLLYVSCHIISTRQLMSSSRVRGLEAPTSTSCWAATRPRPFQRCKAGSWYRDVIFFLHQNSTTSRYNPNLLRNFAVQTVGTSQATRQQGTSHRAAQHVAALQGRGRRALLQPWSLGEYNDVRIWHMAYAFQSLFDTQIRTSTLVTSMQNGRSCLHAISRHL